VQLCNLGKRCGLSLKLSPRARAHIAPMPEPLSGTVDQLAIGALFIGVLDHGLMPALASSRMTDEPNLDDHFSPKVMELLLVRELGRDTSKFSCHH
jgi:hypothetical protein